MSVLFCFLFQFGGQGWLVSACACLLETPLLLLDANGGTILLDLLVEQGSMASGFGGCEGEYDVL
jgi:hypothetical protein